jgi:transposase
MRDPTARSDQQARARQRAQLIMQVRSGVVSAQEAARRLGISRKTYYKWERRALAAMVAALEDRGQGRPPQPRDPEKAALRRQTEALQAKLTVLEQTARLRQVLAQPEKKTPEVAAMLIPTLTQLKRDVRWP